MLFVLKPFSLLALLLSLTDGVVLAVPALHVVYCGEFQTTTLVLRFLSLWFIALMLPVDAALRAFQDRMTATMHRVMEVSPTRACLAVLLPVAGLIANAIALAFCSRAEPPRDVAEIRRVGTLLSAADHAVCARVAGVQHSQVRPLLLAAAQFCFLVPRCEEKQKAHRWLLVSLAHAQGLRGHRISRRLLCLFNCLLCIFPPEACLRRVCCCCVVLSSWRASCARAVHWEAVACLSGSRCVSLDCSTREDCVNPDTVVSLPQVVSSRFTALGAVRHCRV
jgi:hypothetical protein